MKNAQRAQPTSESRAAVNARDRAWVAAAKAGDRRAFGHLVEAYQQRVYAIAFGILRQRDDAWDVAQEAFVKAYRSLDRFQEQSAFYTWLYRIVYNLSIDGLRDRFRRSRVDMTEDHKIEQALLDQGRSVLQDPGKMVDRRELKEVLHCAMLKLSDKHRAIIVLREVQALSYDEMAEVLGISKGTVMSRLFHARKNLQALLRPYAREGNEVPGSLKLALEGV